jgi:hypothetical protein
VNIDADQFLVVHLIASHGSLVDQWTSWKQDVREKRDKELMYNVPHKDNALLNEYTDLLLAR